MNKLSGQSPWWIPIVLLLLTGVGFLIKTIIEQKMNEPTVLVGVLSNPPQAAACFLHGHEKEVIPVHQDTGFFRFDKIAIGSQVLVCNAPRYQPVWAAVEVEHGMNNKVTLSFRKIRPARTKEHLDPEASTDPTERLVASQVPSLAFKEQSRFYSSLADRQYTAAISSENQEDVRIKLLLESEENYKEALLLAPDDPHLREKLHLVRKAINTSKGG